MSEQELRNRETLTREVTRLHAEFCSALADSRRLLLLYALDERPKNVTELTEELGVSQSSVSRHLKIVRERGLVSAERDGSNRMYQLTDLRLIQALDLLRAIMRDLAAERVELMTTSV
jgi:DNA-binding transcriptional ArsR family regulator